MAEVALPRTRAEIARLVPHQGLMCLWEEVLDWSDTALVLRSHGHRAPDHPLRRHGRLHAVHLCEYGAQAMAVHGGLLGQASGAPVRPGMLVALRGVQLHVDTLDGLEQALEGHAELLMHTPDSQQYGFRILHAGTLLAEGRASVMLG
ncbi:MULTISPECIES: phosphotransferase [Pseudoxanthomonas]|uniref:Phosphotransferase n=1 Tax=Pseudoxanthomonas winnipegensis TaxID=2480810 RepID=A0A4Q8L7V2_9GAMM|nr:phosphotransferase [Pseudoxanthomonas winnipegensis]RZZ80896.1 phosphotransferase [Pseudoxanthomonas winnipegensis]TAA23975.1 phosphotransferase [Pseudoxanthomonas winnipegensis]TAA38821.1 phosphotransferase [Pseudoxanthomonas winnipegensis]TAA40041.1 phosphotransferase [Pseudoxanthomonas winnipegensis]TBV74922.1 phosphotransferase [Pseudoxanthomonas winnipegensis]